MTQRDIHDLLAEHPFFEGLGADTLAFVAGCGTNVHLHDGAYLLREGEPADRMYVVRSGHVALEVSAADRDPTIIDTLEAGQVLGVSWLVPPHRWTCDARALGETSAISLDATCLRDKCDEDPALGYELMRRLAVVMQGRLRSARMRLLDVYSHGRR